MKLNDRTQKPPILVRRLLKYFIRDQDHLFLLGDLEEAYKNKSGRSGKCSRVWYWFQFAKMLPPVIREDFFRGGVMIKNNLKLSFRHFKKSKLSSFINVFGLSIGIACCILVYFFVQGEISYDQFHEDIQSIYLVFFESGETVIPNTPGPLKSDLVSNFPEIESGLRLSRAELAFKIEDRSYLDLVTLTDPNFFEFFTFDLKSKATPEIFKEINHLVLSERAALRYFGEMDPVGKIIQVRVGENFKSCEIVAVAKTSPENSSIKFDMLLQFDQVRELFPENELEDNWFISGFSTFIKLHPWMTPESLERKMSDFVLKRFKIRKSGQVKINYSPRPFHSYHLSSTLRGNGLESPRNPSTLYILSGLALVVLFISCFNFMNLSIGNFSTRFREIGLKKVLGAGRSQLVRQFLFESVFLGFIGLAAGMLLAGILLPVFNRFADTSLSHAYFGRPGLLLVILTAVFCISALSGVYPALVLSKFKAVELFRSKHKRGGRSLFSKLLLILQYSASSTLIICTLLMNLQLKYMKTESLGFERENILVLPTTVNVTDREKGDRQLEFFKLRFASDPDIRAVSGCSSSFDRSPRRRGFRNDDGESVNVYLYKTDYDYLSFFGLELLQGRFFKPGMMTDSVESVVVNEAYLRQFNLQEPIGMEVKGFRIKRGTEVRIIGVVRDFHVFNFKNEIPPIMMTRNPTTQLGYIYIKYRSGGLSIALHKLENAWKELEPNFPFLYYFMDEDTHRLYSSEESRQKIISWASFLGILISCLGLLGLSSITVSKRVKEIGIRKVLGARTVHIAGSLSREYMILVAAANLPAWPSAYIIIRKWLQNYAFRTALRPEVFIISGMLVLLLALLTVNIRSVRAAQANPADTLRYE